MQVKTFIRAILALIVTTFFLLPSFSQEEVTESSVEDEYLNDIDGVVILGLAESNEYENKIYALKMVENAIENGNENPDVIKALCQLAGDGLNTQSRVNGKLINNFPDIRRNACLLLGKIKTEEAKTFLVQVVLAESEPMVISAAVNSLGKIGINKDDEVTTALAFMNRRYQILNPTNSLTSEVLDCYAALQDTIENKKIIIDSLTQIASDYHFNKNVRGKAVKLLKSLSGSSSSTQEDKNSSSTSANSQEATGEAAATEPEVQ